MSIKKCYFCSGPCTGSDISTTVEVDEGRKQVWFCLMECFHAWKYGLNYGRKEEPNIVY